MRLQVSLDQREQAGRSALESSRTVGELPQGEVGGRLSFKHQSTGVFVLHMRVPCDLNLPELKQQRCS